jgi:hypothetical protein
MIDEDNEQDSTQNNRCKSKPPRNMRDGADSSIVFTTVYVGTGTKATTVSSLSTPLFGNTPAAIDGATAVTSDPIGATTTFVGTASSMSTKNSSALNT